MPEALLQREQIDFVDIITDVDTHSKFVSLAMARRLPVICQKPMAPTLAIAQQMVSACQQAGVPLHIHENWRWQTPIRHVKRLLDEGVIGPPFRARIDMISGFPVFANQPFLKELEQFIITDLGSHTLDVARFLFGEARRLTCQAHRIHADIKGEDVATILLDMGRGAQQIRSSPPSPGAEQGVTVLVEMAYAGTPLERERFPETFIFVEGPLGSIELGPISGFASRPPKGRTRSAIPRRGMPGPTQPTTWFMPASSRATPTCWQRCAASSRPRPRARTISRRSGSCSLPTNRPRLIKRFTLGKPCKNH